MLKLTPCPWHLAPEIKKSLQLAWSLLWNFVCCQKLGLTSTTSNMCDQDQVFLSLLLILAHLPVQLLWNRRPCEWLKCILCLCKECIKWLLPVAPFPSGHLISRRDVPQGVSTKSGWEMDLHDYSLQLFYMNVIYNSWEGRRIDHRSADAILTFLTCGCLYSLSNP